jgi:alpha-tubulin suppressor-like RCC1 family protein
LPAAVAHVAAGDTHSFAVDTAGRLWGWGSNHLGQVGELLDARAEAKYYTRPRRVKTGFRAAQVDAGMFFTVALSDAGDVFAWGWNGMGQLAQESSAPSHRPLRVRPLQRVQRLSSGVGHTLAIADGAVFAWGDNRASTCGAFPSVAVQAVPRRIDLA